MNTFSLTCTCGDVMKVEAADRAAAVRQLKVMMDEGMVAKHMAEKHPGEPVLGVAAVHAMIEQKVQPSA